MAVDQAGNRPMRLPAAGPAPVPTVFVVDDDASFRTAVSRLLRATGHPVRTFPSASEFLESLPAPGPGCVVADVQMPGLSGLDLQAALAKTPNPLPVLFLTGHGDILTSVRAMRQGAEDFLTKSAPKEELLEAVKRALARDARERAERTRVQGLRARFETLTERDHEVLRHVLRGQLNKQIAADLGIDERSVKRHRTSIMAKLRVQSVAELTHLVHEAGLVSVISNQRLLSAHCSPLTDYCPAPRP
jgi:FixJ family two-component response regulator